MRIHLSISAPQNPLPFDHQHLLVGTIHKWLAWQHSSFILVWFILYATIVFSCNGNSKESFLKNFEKFVANVEAEKNQYTDIEWKQADNVFNEYVSVTYLKFKNEMTQTEREQYNKLVGKYRAFRLKEDIKDFKEQIQDATEQVKTMIEEITK